MANHQQFSVRQQQLWGVQGSHYQDADIGLGSLKVGYTSRRKGGALGSPQYEKACAAQ